MLENLHTAISSHLWETTTAVFALLTAALVTYAREEIRRGINWILRPITRLLPWNRFNGPGAEFRNGLVADLTLVDVFLLDTEGKLARYQKTSSCVVTASELTSYQEGVTAEGLAQEFFTMRGTIIETRKEHGFYISQIDIGETLTMSSRFTNVYIADLSNCFTKRSEHWTQELAIPTKHLTLQIHFPAQRPPISILCKRVEGTIDELLKTTARLVELYGKQSLIWEIEHPKPKEIYKLEWIW